MLESFGKDVREVFSSRFNLEELPEDGYTYMKWPKLLPIMRFHVERYRAEGFGSVMLMHTKAMGGLMQLMTASFTPSEGVSVPYLLIDMMSMKDKRTVFVEYYDCTQAGVSLPSLDGLKLEFSDIQDYDEKPAWYVGERLSCSLIKGGTADDEERLSLMVRRSLEAYAEAVAAAPADPHNLEKLRSFADRMVNEGNPSSGTMEKVLGKDGAERFFRSAVMPIG